MVCAMPTSFGAGFNLAVTAMLFPLLIAAGASHGRKGVTGFASILGELSYPLYILHWPILLLARVWLPGWMGNQRQHRVGLPRRRGVRLAGVGAHRPSDPALGDRRDVRPATIN